MARSVTDISRFETKPEMGVIGYLLAAVSFLVVLPVAPFLAVLWVYERMTGESRSGRTTIEPTEGPPARTAPSSDEEQSQ